MNIWGSVVTAAGILLSLLLAGAEAPISFSALRGAKAPLFHACAGIVAALCRHLKHCTTQNQNHCELRSLDSRGRCPHINLNSEPDLSRRNRDNRIHVNLA